jgi:hypothetical protein
MRHLILGLVAFTLATPAFAQDVARMETVVRADADKGEFMGAVLVARDGEILFDKGLRSCSTRALARPISNGRSPTTATPSSAWDR